MFLYTNHKDEQLTVLARHIEDVELPETAFRVDLELGKRYQEFLREMVRFALLGIAAYGFLIKEILGGKRGPVGLWTLMLAIVSLICLACAVGFGLYCGELNKACLRMQITILRLLQRLSSERWTNPAYSSTCDVEEWRQANSADLERIRKCQRQNLQRAWRVVRLTVWSLVSGIVLTAVVFIVCFWNSSELSHVP